MNKSLKVRLSVMMFLEFFIWGAWYTTVAIYMGNHGMVELAWVPFTLNPVAAIVAPFFVGFIADRYFATEKVLGVLHILGAIFIFFTPQTVTSPTLFLVLLLAYNLCYMPTMSLANSLCFHHLDNQEKQFPKIRVFGTIGWIVAGLLISFGLGTFVAEGLIVAQTALPLYLTSVGSLILGIFCFTLPHTPPPAAGEKVSIRSIAGVDAFKQLGSKPFYIFLVSSLLISIPLSAYYAYAQLFLQNANYENVAAILTIGQASEAIFMILIPIFFVRLGVKWMLSAGMLAWVFRYALFALGAPDAITWMILLGIALHGLCYDFFFVTGQIYVDKKSTSEIRGQAQGLIILATYGVGMLIGGIISGVVFNSFLGGADALTMSQWQEFWWVPAIFAAIVLLFFVIFFHDRVIEEGTTAEDISTV